jgi:hypothetical protein
MDKDLKTYWIDRIGLLLLLAAFFLLSNISFSDQQASWTFILIVTTIFSFTHYFVGWFYQVKSFRKGTDQRKKYQWFLLLALVTTAIALAFILTGQIILFFVLGIGIFMVHGYFNEHTLYNRETGKVADSWLIASGALFLTGLVLLSLAHPSSLISLDYEYAYQGDLLMRLALETSVLPTLGLWFGVTFFVLSFLVELVALLRSKQRARHWLMMLGILVMAGVFYIIYPPNYIYVFAGILLYHFLIWFWVYFKQFAKDRGSLFKYLLLHAIVILPFLPFLPISFNSLVYLLFVNAVVVLSLTAVHIVTSFMNEQWFKRRVMKEGV